MKNCRKRHKDGRLRGSSHRIISRTTSYLESLLDELVLGIAGDAFKEEHLDLAEWVSQLPVGGHDLEWLRQDGVALVDGRRHDWRGLRA